MEPKLNLGDLSPKISKEARKEIGVATRIGLEQARARGQKVGRQKVEIDWEKVESLKKKGFTERAAALECGYNLNTFYRRKKEFAAGLQDEGLQNEEEGRPKPGAGNTYLIHAPSVGRVKIGYATDVKSRLISLQTSSPVPLVLICTFENLGFIFERYLQVKYDDYHVAGEWFDDKILSMIFEDPDVKNAMKQYAGTSTPQVIHYPPKTSTPALSELRQPPDLEHDCSPSEVQPLTRASEMLIADITDLGSDPMSIVEEIQRLKKMGVVPIALNSRDAPILDAGTEYWYLMTSAMQLGENLERSWFQEIMDEGGDPFREQKKKNGRPRIDVNLGAVEYFKGKGLSERKAVKMCGYSLNTYYNRKKEQKENVRSCRIM